MKSRAGLAGGSFSRSFRSAYESDIGDGWEDPQVHHDPQELREQALKMGVNIITWALMN